MNRVRRYWKIPPAIRCIRIRALRTCCVAPGRRNHQHASARESLKADVTTQGAGQQVGIAGRDTQMQAAVSTMVSTINVNAQADVAVRANLVGEVAIKFRTETFDINRFADTQAIQLLTRHSRMTGDGAPAPAAPAEQPRPASAAPPPTAGGRS